MCEICREESCLIYSQLLVLAGAVRSSLTLSYYTSVSTSLQLYIGSSTHVSLSFLSLQGHQPYWIKGPPHRGMTSLNQLYLQSSYFQVRSYSEVMGVRTSTFILGDIVKSIAPCKVYRSGRDYQRIDLLLRALQKFYNLVTVWGSCSWHSNHTDQMLS